MAEPSASGAANITLDASPDTQALQTQSVLQDSPLPDGPVKMATLEAGEASEPAAAAADKPQGSQQPSEEVEFKIQYGKDARDVKVRSALGGTVNALHVDHVPRSGRLHSSANHIP